jgi:hypothetical protein
LGTILHFKSGDFLAIVVAEHQIIRNWVLLKKCGLHYFFSRDIASFGDVNISFVHQFRELFCHIRLA